MATDRELLELAAKAAGIYGLRFDAAGNPKRNAYLDWNPRTIVRAAAEIGRNMK